jgi:hypothetical protein
MTSSNSLAVRRIETERVFAAHERFQRIEQQFRAVKWVHVHFAVLAWLAVGIQDHSRHTVFVRFPAKQAAFAQIHGLPDDHSAHMPPAQNIKGYVD